MALYVNPENQKLLWNIINKHPKINEYFSNKPIANKHRWFQTCIEYIYENIKYEKLTIQTLQAYNKDTLKYMLNLISEPNKQYKTEYPQSVLETQFTRTIDDQASQQYLSKSDILNQTFNMRQKEYEDMVEKKTPESIDFRDKIDDEPMSNMEEVLRTHLQMRENELKQYAPLPLVPENKNKAVIFSDNSNVEEKRIKSVSWEDNDIELLKKQIRELIEKTEKMQEEIDGLKYKKDLLETQEKEQDTPDK